MFRVYLFTVNPIKLEPGLRPNSAGIPYTLLLRIEATWVSNFWAFAVGTWSRRDCQDGFGGRGDEDGLGV